MAIHGTTPADADFISGISPSATPTGSTRGGRSLRTALVALAAVATIGALAGCDGGSTSTDAATTSNSSKASSGSATPADNASKADSSSKAPYTDAQACDWLKQNLPKVPDTEIGAQAQLTIGLSSFFEDHGGLAGADGYALDDAFSRGCPALHSAALKKAGIKTFGNL